MFFVFSSFSTPKNDRCFPTLIQIPSRCGVVDVYFQRRRSPIVEYVRTDRLSNWRASSRRRTQMLQGSLPKRNPGLQPSRRFLRSLLRVFVLFVFSLSPSLHLSLSFLKLSSSSPGTCLSRRAFTIQRRALPIAHASVSATVLQVV